MRAAARCGSERYDRGVGRKGREAKLDAAAAGLGFTRGYSAQSFFDADAFTSSPLPLVEAGGKVEGKTLGYSGSHDVGQTMAGEWRGHRALVLDYYTSSASFSATTQSWGSSTTTHLTCAVIEVPAALPVLAISRAGAIGRLAERLGAEDVEIGHPDFDREFRVKGDAELAREVITVDLAEQIRQLAGEPELQIGGRFIVAYKSGAIEASKLEPLLDAVVTLREAIPESVLSRYPAAAAKEEPW